MESAQSSSSSSSSSAKSTPAPTQPPPYSTTQPTETKEVKEVKPIEAGQLIRVMQILDTGRKKPIISDLPIVPRSKTPLSFLASVAAFIITMGNALGAAGMAFLTISATVLSRFAVISAAGTLFAFTQLYGKSVFPAFQAALTTKSERDEFAGLASDMALAERLGLKLGRQDYTRILQEGICRRRDLRRRMVLRSELARILSESGKLGLADKVSGLADRVYGEVYKQIKAEDAHFAGLLSGYIGEKITESKDSPDLVSSAYEFFYYLYEAELPAPAAAPAATPTTTSAPASVPSVPAPQPPVAELKLPAVALLPHDSIFNIEAKLLDLLTQHFITASSEVKPHVGVGLETALTEISIFHQWLRQRVRRNPDFLSAGFAYVEATQSNWLAELKNLGSNKRERELSAKDAQNIEMSKRLRELKKRLNFSGTPEQLHGFLAALTEAVIALEKQSIQLDAELSRQLFARTPSVTGHNEDGTSIPNQTECIDDLCEYWKRGSQQADNTAISGSKERLFYIFGYIIGVFGAIANAALGFMGLKGLIGFLGLSAIPAAWIPILVIGMIAAFGSSNWMTRLRIIERLMDLGRWFDKDLPVEKPYLRYFSVALAVAGSAAVAYLAYIAGVQMGVFFFALIGVAAPIGFILAGVFGTLCAVSTFFGAGALMTEGVFDKLSSYIAVVTGASLRWYQKLENVIRLFFVGHLGRVDGDTQALKLLIGKILGVALLFGAIASQICFGASPILIVGTVFAVLAMACVYSGVFEVAQDLVNLLFTPIVWLVNKLDDLFNEQPSYRKISNADEDFELISGEIMFLPLESAVFIKDAAGGRSLTLTGSISCLSIGVDSSNTVP